MMMDEGWRRWRPPPPPPFTPSQLRELELQALIFNYMALGIPVPSQLVLPFRSGSYSSLYPSLSFGMKADEDPEPWRCKRTDGKKWRCSREASGDSKYCERHRHRGKKYSAAKPPLFGSPSSTSPYSSPPMSLLLGENRYKKKQDQCFLFGADLKLQQPGSAMEDNGEVHGPKLQLSFFGDERKDPWKDSTRDERATQLSMSVYRE